MLVNLFQTSTATQPTQPCASSSKPKASNNLKPLEKDTCSINFKGIFTSTSDLIQEYLRIKEQLNSINKEIIRLKESVDEPDNRSIQSMLQAPLDQLSLIDKFEERIKIEKELEKVEIKLAKTPEGLRIIKEQERAAEQKKMEDILVRMRI
jgi:hypothetical protein